MSFRKIVIGLCISFRCEISAAEPSSAESCREVTKLIHKMSMKGTALQRENSDPIFDGLLLLASYQDNQSDKCLVEISSYNLGTSWSEYLSDLIEKRGKDILPILDEKIKSKQICDSKKFHCNERYYEELKVMNARINSQKDSAPKLDSTGEPIVYIPREQFFLKFKAFKRDSDAIKTPKAKQPGD